ncbi:hypothetical protein J6590_013123 [Homalodisca vitripennis]|nr:hypothetical protein J6590_013123 [Homalodisca vitripennis]
MTMMSSLAIALIIVSNSSSSFRQPGELGPHSLSGTVLRCGAERRGRPSRSSRLLQSAGRYSAVSRVLSRFFVPSVSRSPEPAMSTCALRK